MLLVSGVNLCLLATLSSAKVSARGSMMTDHLVIAGDEQNPGLLQFTAPGNRAILFQSYLNDTTPLTISTSSGQTLGAWTSEKNDTCLHVNKLKLTDKLDLDGQLVVNGVPQWRLVQRETFQLGVSPMGWDVAGIANVVTQCASVSMLGGYQKFAQGEASKLFTRLPPHTQLRIRALFHFIDNWTGDTAFMRVNMGQDGSLIHVWTASHRQDAGKGINICGASTPDSKITVPIDIALMHATSSIKVAFGSTMAQNLPGEASWGVSVVEIYVR